MERRAFLVGGHAKPLPPRGRERQGDFGKVGRALRRDESMRRRHCARRAPLSHPGDLHAEDPTGGVR